MPCRSPAHRVPAALLALLALLVLPCMPAPAAGQPAQCAAGSFARDVLDSYGERIEFDVLRNGERVGEHVTRFEWQEDGLAVESRMRLDLRILFVPVYSFRYRSESRWCDGALLSLTATVFDNGKHTTLAVARRDARLEIDGAAGTLQAAPDLLPTDHWNARVLGARAVINTLTGNVNEVAIERCAAAAPGGGRTASCFDYRGELEARVWYDRAGRWVGLAFEGRDGSRIEYACRRCGDES